jgi:hypothetical protein
MVVQRGTVATGAVPLNAPTSVDRAGRWLWGTLLFMILTTSLGLAWDRSWHTRHQFETFYSPPHLFIYTTTIITILLVAAITFSEKLRPWFGTAYRLRPFSFPVPGALVITAGGLAMLGFADLALDDYWHTNFGLDETKWSTPHNMLAWSWFVTVLGFVSCRLALRPYRPLRGMTAILLGWLVLTFSYGPFLGPFANNLTPDRVRAQSVALAALPALLNQPGIQHVQRIYLAANLTRTNPLFLLFGALWAGTALAILRRLDRRAWVLLVAVGVFSLLQLSRDRRTALRLDSFLSLSHGPTNWLPPPILPAAVVLVLLARTRLPERWVWASAGIVFGLLTFLTWGTRPAVPLILLCVPLAAPVMLVGAGLGGRIARVLENPTGQVVRLLVPLLGFTAPLILGCVDLYLRHAIA